MPQIKSQTARSDIKDTGKALAYGLLIAIFIRVIAFQPFTIPSSSMSPGLLTGDYIVVSKYAYGWSAASLPFGKPDGTGRLLGKEPERGDVVVFRLPRAPKQIWVKRLIGLPGDTVWMIDGEIHINGSRVDRTDIGATRDVDEPLRPVFAHAEQLNSRSYVTYDGGSDLAGDNTGPLNVPAGHYLVMGDNRDNSIDGRWDAATGVGFVPASNLVGRAEIIAWSWRPGASLLKPWTWHWIRTDRMAKAIN